MGQKIHPVGFRVGVMRKERVRQARPPRWLTLGLTSRHSAAEYAEKQRQHGSKHQFG